MWGENGHGQLGDGTTANQKSTPQMVAALNSVTITSIALGCYHSGALTGDGEELIMPPNCSSPAQNHLPQLQFLAQLHLPDV